VQSISRLLAESGEKVHVNAHRWHGAPERRSEYIEGRLVVHRVALDDPSTDEWSLAEPGRQSWIPRALLSSACPAQAFSWQVALLAERLIQSEQIDIVEAQEWEAPLYYFQLRRALGLGPSRRPPCVVHLHSSTEQIFAGNQWDTTVVDYAPAVAQETYSIAAADAVLCPSVFMADAARARYQLPESSVTVIPYPLGEVPHVVRTPETWASGSICHVGRLEGRKGVIEWTDAVLQTGSGRFTMEFIGGDVPLRATGGPSVRETVHARIPTARRDQFRFHGSLPRADVFQRLSGAFASVVPSRWDNLPYSCIEAMATGLPVIASPNGGMRELIEDGVSGWIAADASPPGLAAALQRALATSPAERAAMGERAERSVRRICASADVVRRHLELKSGLARRGARVPAPSSAAHMGIVTVGQDETVAIQEVQRLSAGSSSLEAIAMVGGRTHLEPGALDLLFAALRSSDHVGLVTALVQETSPANRVRPPFDMTWPDSVRLSEAVGPVVLRRRACDRVFESAKIQPTGMSSLFDGVVRSGWTVVTIPVVLCTVSTPADRRSGPTGQYSLLARSIQRLHTPLFTWLITCSADERRTVIRDALRNPGGSLRRLLGRVLPATRGVPGG
jgi:glycosyltransferase involved in cell wall biosynthesis